MCQNNRKIIFLIKYTKLLFDYTLFKVKKNELPFPNSLSTQIFPPFFSTNSLHSINPNPEPFPFELSSVDFVNPLKIVPRFSS
jgi:hypothetical protein